MATEIYHQLIIKGIDGLPPETLAEIADFVYFVRKKTLHPQAFEELQNVLLNKKLGELSREAEAHLEKEFENYGQLYPRE